jgi:hypothetical protein
MGQTSGWPIRPVRLGRTDELDRPFVLDEKTGGPSGSLFTLRRTA